MENAAEAEVCVALYLLAVETNHGAGLQTRVGVITPYRQQVNCIKRKFREVGCAEAPQVSTIDSYQGQEADIIILSCVRAATRRIGFAADVRRMNVALTRGRTAVWIVGHAEALKSSEHWATLLNNAEARGCSKDARDVLARTKALFPSKPVSGAKRSREYVPW